MAKTAPRKRRRAKIIPRRLHSGAPPGHVDQVPGAQSSDMTCFAFDETQFEEADFSLNAVDELLDRYPVLWVNVVGLADTQRISDVGQRFGIHPLALEDVVHVHQRPKVEQWPDQTAITLRMVRDQHSGETEQISLFVMDRVVVTFQEHAGDSFEPVRDRIRRGAGRIRRSDANYLAYALVDALIDRFFPLFERYAAELEELDELITTTSSSEPVTRVHELKRELLAARRLVWPTREAIGTLVRNAGGHEETRLYWRDCHDHVLQLSEMLEACRDTAANTMETYVSATGQRMNEVMKVLTMIATIFIPLSFVTGMYGMNFDDIPGLHSRWGFAAAIVIMLGIASGMLLMFRRKGWFN